MKKISNLLLIMLIMSLALVSCGGSGEDDGNNGGEAVPEVNIVKTTPENGATIKGEVQITVEFDQLIKLNFGKAITINGENSINGSQISYINQGKTLSIAPKFNAQKGAKYEVVIPSDVVKGYSKEIKITFQGPEAPAAKPSEISKTLVNGNATAQMLYNYMQSIYGSQILSGAIANVSVNQVEAGLVKKLTGKTPAMLTIDYIFSNLTNERSTWEQASIYKKIDTYKAHSDANGIVSACWHLNVPSAETYAAKNDVNNEDKKVSWSASHYFSAREAVKAGTWQNEFLEFSLGQVIEDLKLFKEADIPVVWRPFHEAAGNACITGKNADAWFWWGKDGAEAYIELWKYMFNRFKDEGLDNLIWVWTTQSGIDRGNHWYCPDDSDWYPGDEYVDIVARDMYDCTNASLCASEYEAIKELFPNKMITLGENGNIAKISDAWNAGAKFLYFMPWYDYDVDNKSLDLDKSQHANKAWWQDAAKCGNVLFLEDMPNWRE